MNTSKQPSEYLGSSNFFQNEDQILTVLKAAYTGKAIAALSGPLMHDFGQPILAIRLYAELLIQKLQGQSDLQALKIAQNLLTLADTSAEMLNHLGQFLSYKEGDFKKLNLSELLLSLTAIVKIECKASQIDLFPSIASDLLIMGDASQLRLAFHAFFGALIAQLRHVPKPKSIHVDLKIDDSFACLLISRTPSGVSNQNTSEQPHSNENTHLSIADLGLFIAKSVLDQHSFPLIIKADLNTIDSFKLTFPLK
jgi:phosphoglycerate-specific signal transduction histidine kinase